MSGWSDYVKNLKQDGSTCQDAAIVGYNPFSIWAAGEDGTLCNVTAAEVAAITAKDRSSMYLNGLTVGGAACSLIRDNTEVPDDWIMDLRTKSKGGEPTCNMAIGKTCSALVIVKGAVGAHGGPLNNSAHCMTKYLRGMNM